ncbi:MAG: hypothetical protein NXH75_15510, partial [Halobacteriovoraceae bacterium]|nr:hypothetical protein [Halobacteriovoraceae bacterium]
LNAEVLNFKITGYKRSLHKYSEICKAMGVRHTLLVDVRDTVRLDCMGTVVHMKDFCKSQPRKGKLLRGYLNTKLQEGVCEFGTAAMVSIACDKRDKKYCAKPEMGCGWLQKVYSHELTLDYHSFIEKDVDNVLNCYYSKPIEEKKIDISKVPLPYKEKEVIDRDIFAFDKVKKIRKRLPTLRN